MAGLLDWLTDGSLGGGTSGMDPMGNSTGMPSPLPTPAPAPTMPMPPVQPMGGDTPAAPTSPPAVPPIGNPMGDAQGINPTIGSPPPTPDPTPAAGPPDPPINPATSDIGGGTGGGPPVPPVPMPQPRPAGANAQPPMPAATPAAPPSAPGAPLSLAPTAPGPATAPTKPWQLGDQTALGRALGINPQSKAFSELTGGVGAGLTAAGNSKGKSPFQALTSGAGASLEGANKEGHAAEKDMNAYLAQAIAAKKSGDDAAYKTNYTAYLAAKLKVEQDAAASKDKATVANKNDSPTQLYLAAQRNVAADPLVKGAMTAYQAALKSGNGPTDPEVQKAKAAYEQTVQERQAAHLAGVGLHPQTAADIAKQPGMSQANPINGKTAGITPENITKKLQPGQYYTNPSNGQLFIYKGEPEKSSTSKPSAPSSKPEPANPIKKEKVNADTEDDD